MLTSTASAASAQTKVVGIADQMLDRYDAAAFIREKTGVPIEAIDLERAAKAGTGPVFRRWGRSKPLYRPSDLMKWAASKLSEPIHPRRAAGQRAHLK